MSNIRPIADPALATAMVATFQSIDALRSAPAGISTPRWRILQCIAKAAPMVPAMGELRICSGLNKAALAEHLQALRWRGLIELDGLRLSPTAAAMVGVEQAYPPKDAGAMLFASAPSDPDKVETLRRAIEAMGLSDMSIMPAPTFIGIDLSSQPDVSIEATITFGADGKIEKIEPLPPLTPADVPACMRPDCMSPEETNTDGRGSAAVARPIEGELERDRVATDRAPETPEEAAGSNPAPAQPADLTPSLLAALARAQARKNEEFPTGLKWGAADREMHADAWQKAARMGSETLLRAIRRFHPERCGEA